MSKVFRKWLLDSHYIMDLEIRGCSCLPVCQWFVLHPNWGNFENIFIMAIRPNLSYNLTFKLLLYFFIPLMDLTVPAVGYTAFYWRSRANGTGGQGDSCPLSTVYIPYACQYNRHLIIINSSQYTRKVTVIHSNHKFKVLLMTLHFYW